MNIYSVGDALTPEELQAPILNALVVDSNNYSVLLLQPQGEIDTSISGIGNRDQKLARAQFGKFIEDA